jgi:hypothetical protein
MKKSFIILALLLAPVASFAADKPETYAKLEDIPAPLARQLSQHNTRYEEQYLSQVLQPLRQNTKSKNAIEASDLEKEQQQNQYRGRNFTGETVMRHDRDFDGKVSASEVRESLLATRHGGDFQDDGSQAEYAQMMKKQADDLVTRYDADKDGIITMKEAAEQGKAKKRSRFSSRNKSQLAQLLALDPDKDGKLTVDELKLLAKKSFSTADADGDGILSTKEMQKIRELGLSEPAYGEGCSAPAPAKDDKIVLISADGGGSLSSLGVDGGRLGDMTVVRVNIEKGEGKIYLVVASHGYNLWQLTGDTSRVKRLLLYARGSKMMTGVAGLPAERVSYLKRADADDEEIGGVFECLPTFHRSYVIGSTGKVAERIEKQADAAFTRILGRKPDARGAFAQPSRIDIAADGTATAAAMPEEQPAPEGFDPATWKDFVTINPGGVVMLKKEDVVTELTLEPRDLMPGLAGVAQLVKSGHLSREQDPRGRSLVVVTGGGAQPLVIRSPDQPTVMDNPSTGRVMRLVNDSVYRVLKPIEEYPSRHGGYNVRYLLGADMEVPKDRQGCFIKDGEEDNCR